VNVVVEPVDGEEAWRALGDGYRVEVRAGAWGAPDVLGVPLGSLVRHGERGWAVSGGEAGRAVLRRVQLGRHTDRSVQIAAGARAVQSVEGVRAGEEVVVPPGGRVSAGARVVGSGL